MRSLIRLTAVGAAVVSVVAAAAPVSTVRASDATAVRGVPVRKVARAGATRAVLSYVLFKRPRVRIWRAGKQLFAEAVPKRVAGMRTIRAEPLSGSRMPAFEARDLDGDGEPEVLLLLHWWGTQCCTWSRIYRFDRARNTYIPANFWWGGYSVAPALRDLDGDKRPEFVGWDGRFSALPAPYMAIFEPIRLWSYDHGGLRDITRSYPKLIRRDAAELWEYYLAHRGERRSVRYVLAAWAADQYMLGRRRTVDQTLAEALRRAYLVPEDEYERPRDPVAYIRLLKQFLRKTGYIRA